MAKSGYTSIAATSYDTLKFSWWEDSQSVANNTTTIGWKMELIAGNYGRISSSIPKNWTVTVNGTKYSGTNYISISNNTTKTLASGATVIPHEDDGMKSFAYSFSQEFSINFSDKFIGTKSGSGSDTLDTIARASQPSLVTYPQTTNNVGDFGEEFGIHMNRKSSDFTHTVRYEYGNRSGVIARDVENGVTWAVPLEFMNDIPNDTSASGLIYVDTYNGGTLVGTKYTGFTVTVPASVKPTCTVQVLDDTGNKDRYGSLVKGLSKLHVKTNFYAAYSSPVNAYNVTANGSKYTAAEIVTGVLTKAGTTTITATVTDKRGRTSAAASESFPVLDYSPPKITALAVHRCNSDGTANDRGEFVEVLFSGVVTPLNNKNTAVYTVKYKKTSDDSWTTLTNDVNGWKPSDLNNNYNVNNFAVIFAADGSSSYDVEVSVADNHGTDSRSTSASTAFTLINYHPEGNALRFGGVAEKENTFQNDLDFVQVGNRYAFSTPGVAGSAGYVLMARLTHKKANADTPITFVFTRRLEKSPMTVHVQFKSNSTTVDPDLNGITYEGSNYGAFLVRTAESVWDLYVQKVSAYDTITLQDWYSSGTVNDRMSVEFPGTLAASLPSGLNGEGWHRATPAVLQGIIDCLLPVGMIIQLYSHADPNSMYPGTTWVRIENTFLWGSDANGTIGQTGGEKTHTLTLNEIPAHTHGSYYTPHYSGDKKWAWQTQNGSDMSYGQVSAGGGQPHNNMPPYTQISIWRRTA